MITKYTFGKPFDAESVVIDVPKTTGSVPFGTISAGKAFKWEYNLKQNDIVYGLGQTMKGIKTNGIVKSLRYGLAKVLKKFR